MAAAASSASYSRSRPVLSVEVSGNRKRVSAVYSCFPGTCLMVKLYRSKRSLNHRTHAGRLCSCFVLKRGTRGLWSVSAVTDLPRTNVLNFSNAQVMASASFSIWAYLFSVSVIEREANATGRYSDSSLWRTAPSPYDDASAEMV